MSGKLWEISKGCDNRPQEQQKAHNIIIELSKSDSLLISYHLYVT